MPTTRSDGARDAAPNRTGFSIQRVLSHASTRVAATMATFSSAVNGCSVTQGSSTMSGQCHR